MQLRLEFEEKMTDIKPAIATLEGAMDEVLACNALIELFHVALITGNIINGVSPCNYTIVYFGGHVMLGIMQSVGYVRCIM